MTRSRFLIGMFLAVIFAVPVTQAVVEAARGEWPQALDVFRERPTAAALRAFERQVERASVFAAAARPWMQYFWFAALRNPGEKAVLGSSGWLFYKPDIRYLVEPCETSDPVAAIVRFRDRLARRGIHLLVVPAPGKPSVFPERLSSRAPAAGPLVETHTRELLRRLRTSGVDTVDLLGSFGKEGQRASYLERDTHWTAATARRAAELVAGKIRTAGWFAGGTTEFATRPVSIERVGDVLRMMESPPVQRSYPPEQVMCGQVVLKSTGTLYADDPRSPVLVLGDSFLRMYQTDEPKAAGFIAHLARELQTPLASIVNDGGASTLVRQQLARKPELLEGKKVVVWEFVERDIRFGAEGWQDVELP